MFRSPSLLIGLLGLLFFSHNTLSSPSLPDLGSPDLVTYDAQTEKKWGDAFSTALHEQYDLIEDPESISVTLNIAHKITQQVTPPRRFKFYILDNPEINAFAGPNGIIGLNKGLILNTQSEDELASVIAHEVAHVTQHHLSRTLKQQPQVNLTSFATLLVAILVGTQNPSAGIATYMGGMGLNLQQQLKNSRQHENEADHIGMQYLTAAGYDPHAMGDFFAKLQQQSQLDTFQPPEILLTHPVTESRLAEAENRADQLARRQRAHKNERLTLLKIRLSQRNASQKVPRAIMDDLNKREKCYQKNLQAYRQLTSMPSDFDLSCLYTAEKAQPEIKLYPLLTVQIWLKQAEQLNDAKLRTKALQKLEFLKDLYPHNLAVNIRYAQALELNNLTLKAQKFLEARTLGQPQPYLLYKTLATLMAKQQKNAHAYYYEALAQQSIGNHKHYHILLNRAEQYLLTTDTLLKKKIAEAKHENKNKINEKATKKSNAAPATLIHL